MNNEIERAVEQANRMQRAEDAGFPNCASVSDEFRNEWMKMNAPAPAQPSAERIAELEHALADERENSRMWAQRCHDLEQAKLRGTDERDAERYRWLRQQQWHTAGMFVIAGSKSQVRLGTDCPSLARLDTAIDAAIAASTSL